MSPTIHWTLSRLPAIVTARKMTAATRPAANATVANAVARIIAGIAATCDERRQDRVTQIAEDPLKPCVSYPVTRISHTAAVSMTIAPGTATGVPGAGLARYYISASPSAGPKRFCGLTAVMLAIP